MTHREHPIWEEELMPYFDGQLDAAKASEIANHLETCEDCAAAVADAKGLSQQMTEWKVEDSSQKMRESDFDRNEVAGAEQAHSTATGLVDQPRVWAYGLSWSYCSVGTADRCVGAVAVTFASNRRPAHPLMYPGHPLPHPRTSRLDFELERETPQAATGQQGQQEGSATSAARRPGRSKREKRLPAL